MIIKATKAAIAIATIILIALKLCGSIGWSWQWVLSPIWLSVIAVPFVFIGLFIWALYKADYLG